MYYTVHGSLSRSFHSKWRRLNHSHKYDHAHMFDNAHLFERGFSIKSLNQHLQINKFVNLMSYVSENLNQKRTLFTSVAEAFDLK